MGDKIIFKWKPEIKKYPHLGYWGEKFAQYDDAMDWILCNLMVITSVLAAIYVWSFVYFAATNINFYKLFY